MPIVYATNADTYVSKISKTAKKAIFTVIWDIIICNSKLYPIAIEANIFFAA